MQEVTFENKLAQILAQDSRYHSDAYFFVKEALEHTQKLATKEHRGARKPRQHVTGQELLRGIRDYALAQYGPMSKTVLEEWGIRQCEDFGEIVFNMVAAGLLGKTETDRREDFKNGYDFDVAFRQPFLPANRVRENPELSKPAQP